MPAFLTNEWFDSVDKLTAEAGDLNLPPALAGLALNLSVSEAGKEPVDLSLDGGKIQKGLSRHGADSDCMYGPTGNVRIDGRIYSLLTRNRTLAFKKAIHNAQIKFASLSGDMHFSLRKSRLQQHGKLFAIHGEHLDEFS